MLQAHDHYDWESGGPMATVERTDSANVRIIAAAARVTPAGVGVWSLMKMILIQEKSAGVMTLNYTLARAGGAGTVHGQARIYRAGVAIWIGADNAELNGPTVYTDAAIAQDLDIDDRIEVWGYVAAGATTVCHVEGLEICYDAEIVELARRELSAPIGLADAGILHTVVL